MTARARLLRLVRNLWKVFEDLIAILPAPAWWVLAAGYAILLLYIGGRPGDELPLPSRLPPHSDKVLHFLAYGVLGALLFRAVYPLNPHRRPRLKSAPWVVLIGPAAVGVIDELHQLFVPGRSTELLDMLADALGGAAVLAIGLAWRKHARKNTPPPGKKKKKHGPPKDDDGAAGATPFPPMNRPLRSLLGPCRIALHRLLRPAGIPVKLNGMAFRLDPAVSLPRGRIISYEPEFFAAYLGVIEKGSIVLDVGANQGFHTIAAARLGARVTAFEPAPAAIAILRRMIEINDVEDRVEVIEALVADKHDCLSEFHAARTAVGWASAAYKPPGTRPIDVRTVALDPFCAGRGERPDVVKIDVEGYEFEVLQGMEQLLRRARPTVFCALHPEILSGRGSAVGDILGFLAGLGYRAFTPGGNPVDPATDREVIFRPD